MKRIVFEDTDALASLLYKFMSVSEAWESDEEIYDGIHRFIENFITHDVEGGKDPIMEHIAPICDTIIEFKPSMYEKT